MKKRIKTKRKNHLIIIMIFSIISFYITYRYLFINNINKIIPNDTLIKYMIDNNISTKELNDVINYNLTNPNKLLNYTLGNIYTFNEENNTEGIIINKVNDVVIKPSLYIYNTHQTEEYKKTINEVYSINPSVMITSYILKERLNDYGIESIVETNSIKEILTKNNWNYSNSYDASRILLNNKIEEYPDLKYFIDIHRDSSNYDKTTIEIDGIKYAKVMFIIGKENPDYNSNLLFATNINNKLKAFNPNLSRGIILKEGLGVNGIYNQDINEFIILIEIGGVDNTIDEINNTTTLLAKVLYELIGE